MRRLRLLPLLLALFGCAPASPLEGRDQPAAHRARRGAPVGTLYDTVSWQAEGLGATGAFATALAGAGDVNGDGYDDLVVGGYSWGAYTGRVYLYLGGASGLDDALAGVVEGDETYSFFGYAVAGAGDVNGDGFDDVVVGAPEAHGSLGQAWVFLGARSGLAPEAVAERRGSSGSSDFGYAVAGAGDVNGDGFADVVIGSPGYKVASGEVVVAYGCATGLIKGADSSIVLGLGGDQLGVSVAGAGDMNGDGYDDVIVGTGGYDRDRGGALIFHGSAAGIDTDPSALLQGDGSGGAFGERVAGAGDVNGDGYDDVLVSDTALASAWLYLGSASGVQVEAAVTLSEGGRAADVYGGALAGVGDLDGDGYADVAIGAPGAAGLLGEVAVYRGEAAGLSSATAGVWSADGSHSGFGVGLGGAGDVNGDGYDDLLVGANGGISAGAAYVFPGSAAGALATPELRIEGVATAASLGSAAAFAGDIDADGYLDVLVGAEGQDTEAGAAWLFLGSASGPHDEPDGSWRGEAAGDHLGRALGGLGDVNGDGYGDFALGLPSVSSSRGEVWIFLGDRAGGGASPDLELQGGAASDLLGSALAAAGDLNGDGWDDFLISAMYASGGLGQALVWYGSPTGPAASPDTTLTDTATSGLFGRAAAGLGDVNGDGYADLAVASPRFDSYRGRVAVFLGGASGVSSEAAATVQGAAVGDQLGWSVAAAGDQDHDGLDDLLIGAPSASLGAGAACVYAGDAASGLSGAALSTLTGIGAGDAFGYSVSRAGDLDEDGAEDLVVGAPAADTLAGTVSFFLGGAAGPSTTPALLLPGEVAGLTFGSVVAGGQDLNRDDVPDLLVAAENASWGAGRVQIFLGAAAIRDPGGDGSAPADGEEPGLDSGRLGDSRPGDSGPEGSGPGDTGGVGKEGRGCGCAGSAGPAGGLLAVVGLVGVGRRSIG